MPGSLRLMAIVVATLVATPVASVAATECALPDTPAMPEGRTASKEQIIAAIGSVKTFQAALEDYRECLDLEIEALGKDAARKDKKLLMSLYDDSVDLEEALATRLNVQIRAYKAQSK